LRIGRNILVHRNAEVDAMLLWRHGAWIGVVNPVAAMAVRT